jgi:hypothetical protein
MLHVHADWSAMIVSWTGLSGLVVGLRADDRAIELSAALNGPCSELGQVPIQSIEVYFERWPSRDHIVSQLLEPCSIERHSVRMSKEVSKCE